MGVDCMAWITTIDENDAENQLKKYYEDIIKKRGKLSNILQVQSLLPDTMKSHLDFYLSIMFNKSKIRREEKELIAVIVSSLNNCQYCINHHAEALSCYWKDWKSIQDVIANTDQSKVLNENQKKLVRYVKKLTTCPSEIVQPDIEELRQSGYDDRSILEIALIVSYFNFVNRMALGLGVVYNEEEMKGYRY